MRVPSALLLLEDVEFYRARSRSLRGLLGGAVVNGRSEVGELRDLLLAPDGSVEAVVVEAEEGVREVHPAGMTVGAEHVSTA